MKSIRSHLGEQRHAENVSISGPRHRQTSWTKSFSIATAAVAAFAMGALTFGGTSGTMALWNDQAEIPGATIQTGSLEIAIVEGLAPAPQGQTSIPLSGAPYKAMFPGEIVNTQLTLTNQGLSPATISAFIDPVSVSTDFVDFRLAPGSCEPSAHGVTLTADDSVPIGATLAPGGSGAYCLQVQLDADAPGEIQDTQLLSKFSFIVSAR